MKKDVTLIYQYFTSGLSPKEKEAFDARLEHDRDFQSLFADYQLLFAGFKALQLDRFHQKVKTWEPETLPAIVRTAQAERIRQYLSGNMTAPEQAAFEEDMKKETDLADRVADYRPLFEGFKALQMETFRERLDQWHEELRHVPEPQQQTPKKNRRIELFKYAAAAIIALGISFAGLKWYAEVNYSTQVLIDRNYSPRKTPATLSSQADLFREGYNAYQAKNFNQAINFFSQVPNTHPRFFEAQLFLGYAYFEDGQLTKAERAFQTVVASNDQRFAENAEWHLLLTYLRQNPESRAFNTLLEKLSDDPGHGFHEEALDLRASLQTFWRKFAEDE